MYCDIIDALMESESQPLYIFRNFVDFFGKKGVREKHLEYQETSNASQCVKIVC